MSEHPPLDDRERGLLCRLAIEVIAGQTGDTLDAIAEVLDEWEIDHLLPLSAGGSNDVLNLWPQAAPRYKGKDAAEAGLHAGICKPGVDVTKVHALQQAFIQQWSG